MNAPAEKKIEAELEQARETLRSAKMLLEGNAMRDATSRAYYAAFHAARAVLWSRGYDAKTHKGTLSQLDLHLVKARKLEKVYSKIVHSLHNERDLAEYHAMSGSFIRPEVEKLVNDAENFIRRMEQLVDGNK